MLDACICIDVDYDGMPTLFRDTMVKAARKEHVCCECGEPIKVGESYERAEGLWEDSWDTWKTCELCVRIRKDLFPCGFYYGQMREDILEYFEFDYVTGRWLEEGV